MRKLSKDIQEKADAQRKYCDDNNLPFFAPSDGHCYS